MFYNNDERNFIRNTCSGKEKKMMIYSHLKNLERPKKGGGVEKGKEILELRYKINKGK